MVQKYLLVNWSLITSTGFIKGKFIGENIHLLHIHRALTSAHPRVKFNHQFWVYYWSNSTEFRTKRGEEDSGHIFRLLTNSVSQLNIVLFSIMK